MLQMYHEDILIKLIEPSVSFYMRMLLFTTIIWIPLFLN
jgi:hypothetical protein